MYAALETGEKLCLLKIRNETQIGQGIEDAGQKRTLHSHEWIVNIFLIECQIGPHTDSPRHCTWLSQALAAMHVQVWSWRLVLRKLSPPLSSSLNVAGAFLER